MGWALPSRGRRPGAGGAAAVHPEERPPRLPRESDSLRERARDKLDAAREQGRAFRRLVQLPALRAAAACIFAGTAVPITYTIVSVATGAHDARHLTMVKVGYCVVIPAVIVVLFVLMPTDVRLNRRAAALLSLASALGGLLELYITEEYVRSLVLRRECVLVETGTPTTCEHAIVDAALQGSVGCVLLMLTLSLCMLLLRSSHASELLLRTCRNVGYTLSYVGVCDFARNALAAGLGLWTPSAHFLVLIALGSEMVAVGGALLVPSVRARVHGWLASRGEAVGTAVGIAALIDGNDADDVNRLAATLFRAVPANLLEFSDFASNERADPSLMLRKSTPAHFGEVDAFLSHSWHDDAETKWVVLQAWREAFVAKHRREPLIWIDRLCLPQNQLEVALVCLPVFLAGCNSLLVLAGKTYLKRLWCCVELYVFFEMGVLGDDQLLLHPLPEPGSTGALLLGLGRRASSGDTSDDGVEQRAAAALRLLQQPSPPLLSRQGSSLLGRASSPPTLSRQGSSFRGRASSPPALSRQGSSFRGRAQPPPWTPPPPTIRPPLLRQGSTCSNRSSAQKISRPRAVTAPSDQQGSPPRSPATDAGSPAAPEEAGGDGRTTHGVLGRKGTGTSDEPRKWSNGSEASTSASALTTRKGSDDNNNTAVSMQPNKPVSSLASADQFVRGPAPTPITLTGAGDESPPHTPPRTPTKVLFVHAQASAMRGWVGVFDVRDAECFDPSLRQRLLFVIESSYGTDGVFNERVKDALGAALERRVSAAHARPGLASLFNTTPSGNNRFTLLSARSSAGLTLSRASAASGASSGGSGDWAFCGAGSGRHSAGGEQGRCSSPWASPIQRAASRLRVLPRMATDTGSDDHSAGGSDHGSDTCPA